MKKKINYEQISEITVKIQEELDLIPLDFKGQIYIENAGLDRVIIKNKYIWRIVARENSSVVARENSSVEARENSSVVAWENSSVVARGNSSVEATANVQVVETNSFYGKLKISGNARIVYMPKNIHEFMDFYGIKYTKTKAIIHKAVHKTKDGKYLSDWDREFEYVIGKKIKTECSQDVDNDCGQGIHGANINWALNFGKNWNDLAIIELETKIKDIVLPKNTDGKIRTGEVKVLREVPLNECGVYGRILEKRIKNASN